MLKKFKNEKGATLVLVMIILTVLIILAGMLMEMAIGNYKISKTNGYMDGSYYAAESAIQKCCDLLKQKCDVESLAKDNSISYAGNKVAFAKSIVSILNSYITTNANEFKNLQVDENSANKADVKISLRYMDCSYSFSDPEHINISIGITADSSYVVKPYVGGDKRAFAEKTFTVHLPPIFRLKGPIYTIGDFMADNSTVNLLGDVHVYGTSPELLTQPAQYYYGGIYAKRNSTVKINGNAYSRSFIRTGKYSAEPDNSSIYIFKDAVAQCIQNFGTNDDIVVMRNVYTFDDVEVNGENSVIAINGSCFGLSDGSDGRYHDASSAIVNSAVIHHANSPASQRSRIVVNGDVMINGGTFRLDPDLGTTLHQIEDASVAWLLDEFSVAYKSYPSTSTTLDKDYIDWLKAQNVAGFGNLFQVFSRYTNPSTAETDITSFLGKIDNARGEGSNNQNFFDIKPTTDSKVAGYSNYAMAANDRMYYIDTIDISKSQVEKAKTLFGSYVLDNIDIAGGWTNFWDTCISGGWGADYCDGVRYKMNGALKLNLLELANIFLTRTTDATNTKLIEHKSPEIFNNLTVSLNALTALSSPYIVDITGSGNLSTYTWDSSKYYLVINDNPNKDLELSTAFNGVIFTTGKVILKSGAYINGAIIAAGQGFDATAPGYVAGSAAETDAAKMATRAPMVMDDGANLDTLDNGGYAAVYCTGPNITVNFPYTGFTGDQEAGRKALLDIFLGEGIDLYNIF